MVRTSIAGWSASVALSVLTMSAVGHAQQPPAAPPTPGAAPAGGRMVFTEPAPFDFNDHTGYVSLFDGVSLKGWDGNPKFWRVENGAIVGESTPTNPSGNNYIVYRDLVARDFTLKFEIKVEGDGGSGIQYRSQTGLPWLANIAPAVTANVGPVNLNWMMTGPQADFWPSRVYTGQFYSENTPMRILAWRGQVVEGFGARSKTLVGTIADRAALGAVVKANDWNQYVDHRARRYVRARRQRPADGGDDRRRSRLVQQSARPVRHRDRSDDEGVRAEYVGQEDQLKSSAEPALNHGAYN